jgi:hypothetical protein
MLEANKQVPLREFRAIPRERWLARVEMRYYDQAWSLVHFLMEAEGGRFRAALGEYLKDVAAGDDQETSYNRYLNGIPNLERRWREWWLALPDSPTAHGYARATVAILTSFLARAEAAGRRVETFEALLRTPADQIVQREEDWLPPTLFAMGVAEAGKLQRRGEVFALTREAGASILLTMKDGTKVRGNFSLDAAGKIMEVKTDIVLKGSTGTRPATTRAVGEMLR